MNKQKALDIVKKLNSELFSDVSIKREYVSNWFVGIPKTKNPLYYRRISFGIKQINDLEYELIVRIYTRTKKVLKLAQEIVDKVGSGKIERVICKNLSPSLLGKSLGSSVSCKERKKGTIGGFVIDSGGKEGLITAGHVLPNFSSPNVVKAYSPALGRFSILKSNREIGHVVQSHPPIQNDIVEVDIALAYTKEEGHNNRISKGKFKGKEIKLPSKPIKLKPNQVVYKLGRNKKISAGLYNIEFEEEFIDVYGFKQFFTVKGDNETFAKHGDSGGIVFTEDKESGELYALGTVVGAKYIKSPGISRRLDYVDLCIIPIKKSLNVLKAKLL